MSSDDSFEFEDDGEELAVGAVGAVAITEIPAETESNVIETPANLPEIDLNQDVSPVADSVPDPFPPETSPIPVSSVTDHSIEKEEEIQPEIENTEGKGFRRTETGSVASSIDPLQGTLAELLSVPLGRPRKRVEHKKDESKPSIPVLNRDTENPNTYDLDYLLDSQRLTKATHRFVTTTDPLLGPTDKSEDNSDIDFIRRNIESTVRPKPTQSSMSASLSLDALPVKKTHTLTTKEAEKLADRLVSYKQQVEMKVKQTQESIRYKETMECTFTPEIKKTKANRPRRKPEEMYYDGVSKAKEMQEKQERMRDMQTLEVSSFRPVVNQQSKKMLEKRGRDPTPVYEKLYSAHKDGVMKQLKGGNARSRSVGDALTFRPTINKRSEDLSRPSKVNDALYADAKRRQERQKEVPKVQPFEPKLSKNSEKVLLTRFEEDFSSVWSRYSGLDVMTTCTPLRQLVQEMGFETEGNEAGKIWEMLEGEQRGGVRKKDVMMVLATVMRFKPRYCHNGEAVEGKLGRFQGDEFVLGTKEVSKLQKIFEGSYEARLSLTKRQSSTLTRLKPETYTFKPDLTQSNRQFRARSNSVSTSRETRLSTEPERLQLKLQQARDLLEQKKMAECTFKPTLKPSKYRNLNSGNGDSEVVPVKRQVDRNLALYQMAQLSKAKREKELKEKAEKLREMETNECTFAPNLDLFECGVERGKQEKRAEGVKESIDRLRKAREEKDKIRKAGERGEPGPRNGKRKGTETEGSTTPATPGIAGKPNIADLQMTASALNPHEIARKLEAIPKVEVMTLGISVRPGVTEDLTLYEGDDLFAVVSAFASKHGEFQVGLGTEEAFKLRTLISEQLLE